MHLCQLLKLVPRRLTDVLNQVLLLRIHLLEFDRLRPPWVLERWCLTALHRAVSLARRATLTSLLQLISCRARRRAALQRLGRIQRILLAVDFSHLLDPLLVFGATLAALFVRQSLDVARGGAASFAFMVLCAQCRPY